MLQKFKQRVASWFRSLLPQLKDNLIQGKLLIFLVGGLLAVLNLKVDPAFYITVPLEDCPFYRQFADGTCQINESNIRAAGFTLITAVAFFASVLRNPKTRVDEVVERGIRLLGVVSAFGAGWFWLEAETFGHPWAYVGPMLGIVFLGAYAVVGGGFLMGGVVMAFALARQIVPAVTEAIYICLRWAIERVVWQFLRAIYRRIGSLLP